MATSERQLKVTEVIFTEGRDIRDSIKFEINEEDPIKEIVALIADDGEATAVVNMTLEEYIEFQRAVNRVGRRIKSGGEAKLDLMAALKFIRDHGFDVCDHTGPIAPEAVDLLAESFITWQQR